MWSNWAFVAGVNRWSYFPFWGRTLPTVPVPGLHSLHWSTIGFPALLGTCLSLDSIKNVITTAGVGVWTGPQTGQAWQVTTHHTQDSVCTFQCFGNYVLPWNVSIWAMSKCRVGVGTDVSCPAPPPWNEALWRKQPLSHTSCFTLTFEKETHKSTCAKACIQNLPAGI